MIDLAHYRVVLAHDDSDGQERLRREFEASPHFTVVSEATTGVEAINQVARYKPDVVVMGLLTPVISALAALPVIRAASPATAVMVLAADPNLRMARVATERGADLCEQRDLPARELVDRLHTALSARPPRRHLHPAVTPPW